jgi:integrase
VGKDPDLTDLMSNFARDGARPRSTVPVWDLSLVLLMLTKAPFEPLHCAELKFVIWKTVFLLALATGKHRSELHAMRSDVLHSKDWGSITVLPDPEFVSKTQLANKGSAVLNVVTIKALTKDLGSDMVEDRSLCAVRALRHYLKATETLRQGRTALFLPFKKGCTEKLLHVNTLSGWIKKTILYAYDSSSKDDLQVTGVKAHSVRALAASWAFHTNVSMEDIMNACSWKNSTTFTRFYLKDMAMIRDEMFHLGPVVAAYSST